MNGTIRIVRTHECVIAMFGFEDFAFVFAGFGRASAVSEGAKCNWFAAETRAARAHAGQSTASSRAGGWTRGRAEDLSTCAGCGTATKELA